MNPLEVAPDDPRFVAVREARTRRGLEETLLVLRATGIAHGVSHVGGRAYVVVPREVEVAALAELDAYDAESARAARAPTEGPRRELRSVWAGSVLAAAVMLLGFVAQYGGAAPLDVTEAGRMDAARFTGGEWWRCVTALCLHADVPHLAGNLVFGLAFGALLTQLVGNGVGWAAVVLSGALGNAVNGWVQPPDHLSLGASTAVFGALGLVTALSLRLRAHLRSGRLRRWAPLVMGVALLGYLGTAGERTDVAAHVLGFLAGLAGGLALAAAARERAPGPGVQWAAGALAIVTLVAAWTAAARAAG